MPRTSPFIIILTDDERNELESKSRQYTLPYYQVVRAQMILMAADGMPNDQIADRLNTRREIVSRWRKRFYDLRIKGLEELPRPGRPRGDQGEQLSFDDE
jgi:hypothetical protein